MNEQIFNIQSQQNRINYLKPSQPIVKLSTQDKATTTQLIDRLTPLKSSIKAKQMPSDARSSLISELHSNFGLLTRSLFDNELFVPLLTRLSELDGSSQYLPDNPELSTFITNFYEQNVPIFLLKISESNSIEVKQTGVNALCKVLESNGNNNDVVTGYLVQSLPDVINSDSDPEEYAPLLAALIPSSERDTLSVTDMLLRFSASQNPNVRLLGYGTISNLLQSPMYNLEGKQRIDTVIKQSIEQFGLPYEQTMRAWQSTTNKSENGMPNLVQENLQTMHELEQSRPEVEICFVLFEKFGLLDLRSHPFNRLLKQFDERDNTTSEYQLFYHSRADPNYAFSSEEDLKMFEAIAEEADKEGVLTRIIESGSIAEGRRIQDEMLETYGQTRNLFICAHSDGLELLLSTGYELQSASENQEEVIHVEDLKSSSNNVFPIIAPRAHVALLACKAGEGGIAQELSQRYDADVIGSSEEAATTGFKKTVDETGQPMHIPEYDKGATTAVRFIGGKTADLLSIFMAQSQELPLQLTSLHDLPTQFNKELRPPTIPLVLAALRIPHIEAIDQTLKGYPEVDFVTAFEYSLYRSPFDRQPIRFNLSQGEINPVSGDAHILRTVEHYRKLAQSLGTNICIGTICEEVQLESGLSAYMNTAVILGKDGSILPLRRKYSIGSYDWHPSVNSSVGLSRYDLQKICDRIAGMGDTQLRQFVPKTEAEMFAVQAYTACAETIGSTNLTSRKDEPFSIFVSICAETSDSNFTDRVKNRIIAPVDVSVHIAKGSDDFHYMNTDNLGNKVKNTSITNPLREGLDKTHMRFMHDMSIKHILTPNGIFLACDAINQAGVFPSQNNDSIEAVQITDSYLVANCKV